MTQYPYLWTILIDPFCTAVFDLKSSVFLPQSDIFSIIGLFDHKNTNSGRKTEEMGGYKELFSDVPNPHFFELFLTFSSKAVKGYRIMKNHWITLPAPVNPFKINVNSLDYSHSQCKSIENQLNPSPSPCKSIENQCKFIESLSQHL